MSDQDSLFDQLMRDLNRRLQAPGRDTLTWPQIVPYEQLVNGVWPTGTMTGDIVRDIWTGYLEPFGVLLGAIAPGVALAAHWQMQWLNGNDVLHRLAEISGYVCWVDDKARLHFGPEADRTDWHFY